MNKLIIITLLALLTIGYAIADVQELPDVEISGPSYLKTEIEKRGLITNELLISDVADSIKPHIPNIVNESTLKADTGNCALYFDIRNKLNFNTFFVCDSILSLPVAFVSKASRYHPRTNWSHYKGMIGLIRDSKPYKLGVNLQTNGTYSHYDIDFQSVSAINLHYRINEVRIFKKKMYVDMKAELQQNHIEASDTSTSSNKMYVNEGLGIGFDQSKMLRYHFEAGFIYKTPLINLSSEFNGQQDNLVLNVIKGISISASDQRIVPGIHIYKRIQLSSNNSLSFFQKSAVSVHDNLELMKITPWQKLQSDAMITFQPIDTHLQFNNTSLIVNASPISITADAGISYLIDGPILMPSEDESLLPKCFSKRIVKNNVTFKALYVYGNFRLTQSIDFRKGWLMSENVTELAYEPLITIDSGIQYKKKALTIQTWFNQYYNTKDDLGEYLRESIDIGGQIDYKFNPNFTLYLQALNLLNKGRFDFRTLPTEPVEGSLGFLLSF